MSALASGAIRLGDNVIYPLPLADGGVLLVDGGPDFTPPDGEPTWDAAVRQLGVGGSAPRDVRAVLVTHAHIDHAGLVARWAEAGARILVGEADVAAVRAGRASNEAQREPRFAEMRRHGCPQDVIARLAALRGTRSLRWRSCPAAAIDVVASEREITLAGGETLRVIPAPGHTPGNLVAFVPQRGDLYSGDTILPTTIPTAGLHFPAAVDAALAGDAPADAARWPSLPPFLRSVAALRALPVRRVLPGHGDVVTAPDTLFERFAAHHARRARRVQDALESGPTTAYAIARGIFPRLPAERIGQAVTEVLGHVDVLAEQGEAAADADAGGMVEWRLV